MRVCLGVLFAVLMLIPGVSQAQTIGGNSKVFLDLNLFGMSQSAAKETTYEFKFEAFDEEATISATYPKPKRTNESSVPRQDPGRSSTPWPASS